MSFRFFRRIRIAPGISLNLSKTGMSMSMSVGSSGAKFTVGTRGTRATIGLPGTGLSYSVSDPLGKAKSGTQRRPDPVPASRRPSLGFFKRLITPAHEESFVDGLAALSDGQEAEALRLMEAALDQDATMADAAWLAAFMRLKLEHFDTAARHFQLALQQSQTLGQMFGQYGLTPRIGLPVTPEVIAELQPNAHSALLGLVEALQLQGKDIEAVAHLEILLDHQADDPVVLASYAELVLDMEDQSRWQRVVKLTAPVGNETAVHTAVLLQRGQALVRLGMDHAAEGVLTTALRRTTGRAESLLREIRYQRALVYERLGKRAQARRELERVYAEDPGFEGVAQRLGVNAAATTV
jgi:tetratricopeptide (TPR) repeat protein